MLVSLRTIEANLMVLESCWI